MYKVIGILQGARQAEILSVIIVEVAGKTVSMTSDDDNE